MATLFPSIFDITKVRWSKISTKQPPDPGTEVQRSVLASDSRPVAQEFDCGELELPSTGDPAADYDSSAIA